MAAVSARAPDTTSPSDALKVNAQREPETSRTSGAHVAKDLLPHVASSQMQQWQDAPEWADESPRVQVSNPKGTFLQLNCSAVIALPPAQVFDILCDPGNTKVFKSVKGVRDRQVVEETETTTVVELELVTGWRFLIFSGEFGVRLRLTQDRSSMKVNFELQKSGFMRQFKGEWCVEPIILQETTVALPEGCHSHNKIAPVEPAAPTSQGRVGSRVTLLQQAQPALSPPPILAQYLRQIAAKALQESLQDMQAEAARIRHGLTETAVVPAKLKKSHAI